MEDILPLNGIPDRKKLIFSVHTVTFFNDFEDTPDLYEIWLRSPEYYIHSSYKRLPMQIEVNKFANYQHLIKFHFPIKQSYKTLYYFNSSIAKANAEDLIL